MERQEFSPGSKSLWCQQPTIVSFCRTGFAALNLTCMRRLVDNAQLPQYHAPGLQGICETTASWPQVDSRNG